MQEQVKPGRWIYWLAAGIFIIGLVVFISVVSNMMKELPGAAGSMMSSAMSMGASLDRFVVPGDVEISVTEPGRYVIYHEHRSLVAGKTYAGPPTTPPVTVTVVNTDTAAPITISRSVMNETYSYPDYEGRGEWEFDAPAAGAYRVAATFTGATTTPVVLAVGRGIVPEKAVGLMGGTCLGTLVCLLCSAAALTIMIVALVKRSRSKSQMTIPPAIPMAAPPPFQQ